MLFVQLAWYDKVSGWCEDGNTSSRTITEVKQLELNQFSFGWYFHLKKENFNVQKIQTLTFFDAIFSSESLQTK